ncbi:MAG: biotin/lipoyl-binding protein [Chitinophagaceae bacterium]|nr:MAG: biotin/lipoyl-binding protein [Chitinophagaceae bacterium]
MRTANFSCAFYACFSASIVRSTDSSKAIPNILLQMLIRGSNGVGYKAYPDNLIEEFVAKSWDTGVDVFRVFDSLNWVKAMAPCIDFVRKRTGGIAEGSICYTGDILDPSKTKYTLDYYLRLAKDIENAGAHMLCIKDMAGLLKPYAAKLLLEGLQDTVKIPIHLHTHDTSSLQPATYLKAIEAGVDVVDVALGALSGLTSQPNFNAVVEMMRFQEREQPYDITSLNQYSNYWEAVREMYYPFESGMIASSAEVFQHEIPGGQYSNLKPQAQSLGLGDKWEDIKRMYADVNQAFGDIVKVTPSSKVVGDMALYLVTNNLTIDDLFTKGKQISFPESVQSFFKGDIGQPEGGFPKDLQKIILKDIKPYKDRPNEHLQPVDFEKEFEEFKAKFDASLQFTDFLSYQLYPKVFEEYFQFRTKFGSVDKVPSPIFFYGMKPGDEMLIEIDKGKSVVVNFLSLGEPKPDGVRTVFFKLNGQNRHIEILDKSLGKVKTENPKAEKGNDKQVGAPLQGRLSKILVKEGQKVKQNEPLFIIEAMKMETTVTATAAGTIKALTLAEGSMVNTDDLVLSLS